MDHTIVRLFESFEQADKARSALLADGFERAMVQVNAREDEAGAVKGNFTVGDYSGDADDPVYERNFAHTAMSSQSLITVTAPDAASAERAAEIMRRCGGLDVDPLKRPH